MRRRIPLPPVAEVADGGERRIGVELEFTGLDVEAVAKIVARHVKGKIDPTSRYEIRIGGDDAGEWLVELDYAYLKEKAREDEDPEGPLGVIEKAAEAILRVGAEMLVPVEVVSPPLPMRRLYEMESLIATLREEGARGTGESPVYAFGMQLNPEMPSLDAPTITRYLKAFLCLYDWLVRQSGIDTTRKLTTYIEPFPLDYAALVVDVAYRPDLPTLIDDYLTYNPTRNRALDMLPLFLHLDEDRVRAVITDPRVKPRPALHYRLPNCEIERANWGIHVAWADWLQVEHLAAEPDRLDAICRRYVRVLADRLGRWLGDWGEQVEQWLKPRDAL